MMTARTATASGILERGGALIVALGLVTLASENTSAFPFFNRYYKILNLRTFNPSYFCSKADCESHASDVNIHGQVTGWSRGRPFDDEIAPPFIRAFRTAPNAAIDADSALELLNCTPPNCGPYFSSEWRTSFGNGINDSGWIVGQECAYGHANDVCRDIFFPFVAPGVQTLSLQLPVAANSFLDIYSANAINNLGGIVGVGPEGGWIGITGSLMPSGIASPEDVNDHGVVVGRTTSDRAFRWLIGSSPSAVEDLGTLDPTCATCTSIAHAINDAGRIVGASQKFAALPDVHRAFIWRRRSLSLPGHHMTDLGTLCLGTESLLCSSRALDINNHQDVVGTSETFASGDGNPHAFLYKGSAMTDINTLLSPSDQAAWILVEATAINDLGQIVGTGMWGRVHNRPRAYLLTPPLLSILANLKGLPSLSGVLASARASLAAKLERVEAAVERGDLADARRRLGLYQDEVQAFKADRRLSHIQATKLLAGVALVQREIEGDRRR
jgi:probable HAF family extracellular repeat protein